MRPIVKAKDFLSDKSYLGLDRAAAVLGVYKTSLRAAMRELGIKTTVVGNKAYILKSEMKPLYFHFNQMIL